MLIVLTTTSTAEEAENLAGQIVDRRLAACVQILPQVRSVYLWGGEVKTEGENLLLIKTLTAKYPELENFILENHSYDTPEVVAIPVERIADKYLGWVASVLEEKP
jgi:uncharacterized protein involved in tolerance to divalent cations